MQETANEPDPGIATFAGGCFWCVESAFQEFPGVETAVSGFAGGEEENPTYKQVSSGTTGHRESVQLTYDPSQVTYEQLLNHFWKQIDPTDDGGQFVDRGFQYTSAIFYHTKTQQRLAEESKRRLEESGRFDKPIVTAILPYTTFYPAEEYHQDYYEKSPLKYKFYRFNSGRDQYRKSKWTGEELEAIPPPHAAGESIEWAEADFTKPSDEQLQTMLSPLQYKVTQEEGTEPAFDNAYWNNTEPGIYVDIVSREPLFSSIDKFKSGTGWPSFTRPLDPDNIVEKKDYKLFLPRTEIRSKLGDNHLGHVFNDGPEPTGKRYCMNSAALRFIPVEDLKKEGYGEYEQLFS